MRWPAGLSVSDWMPVSTSLGAGKTSDTPIFWVGRGPYPTRPYEGSDPLGYVVSANIHRRHLNETQRAVLALNIERHEAEAAAQRMLAGKRNPEEPVPQG